MYDSILWDKHKRLVRSSPFYYNKGSANPRID